MKTFVIEGFEVLESDGNGVGDHLIAIVSTQEPAEKLQGESPSRRVIRPHKETIVVFESMDEYQSDKRQKSIKAALSKLSKEEIHLLGLHKILG